MIVTKALVSKSQPTKNTAPWTKTSSRKRPRSRRQNGDWVWLLQVFERFDTTTDLNPSWLFPCEDWIKNQTNCPCSWIFCTVCLLSNKIFAVLTLLIWLWCPDRNTHKNVGYWLDLVNSSHPTWFKWMRDPIWITFRFRLAFLLCFNLSPVDSGGSDFAARNRKIAHNDFDF